MSKNHLQNDQMALELEFMQDDPDPVRQLFPDTQRSYERVGLAGPVPKAVEPLGHPRQQRLAGVPKPLDEIDVTINGKVVGQVAKTLADITGFDSLDIDLRLVESYLRNIW